MESPEHDADADPDNACREGENEIGQEQEDKAKNKKRQPIDAIGQRADRIRGQRIGNAHDHQDERYQHQPQANRLRAQHDVAAVKQEAIAAGFRRR
jgi:hypothetical protein